MRTARLNGRRILVLVYGHVADTMAAVPGLRSLRRSYPSARIEVLVVRGSEPILRHCPYIDELVTWQDFQLKGSRFAKLEKAAILGLLGARLRSRHYDAALVFHRSFRSIRRLAATSGATLLAGVADAGDGYTHPVAPPVGIESSREENGRVLEAIGIEDDGGPIELWTTPEEEAAADQLLARSGSGPLIGLHPGSDWSCQQWLPEAWAEVGRSLRSQRAARLVITGSDSEGPLQEEIANGLGGQIVRTAGATSLGELVALVRRLDLLICVNSAPAAIARAVGTPAVVLLGPEDPRLTGLEAGKQLRIVQPGRRREPGSWCEFGRWGVLSGCDSPMCRGIGGLDLLDPADVTRVAMTLLERPATARFERVARGPVEVCS